MSETRVTALERELIEGAIARLRAGIMAIVFGMVSGSGLFLATAWLLLRGQIGEDEVGSTLGLLNVYFPGYSVTWPGAVVGFLYGGLVGGIVGWALAWFYNRLVRRG